MICVLFSLIREIGHAEKCTHTLSLATFPEPSTSSRQGRRTLHTRTQSPLGHFRSRSSPHPQPLRCLLKASFLAIFVLSVNGFPLHFNCVFFLYLNFTMKCTRGEILFLLRSGSKDRMSCQVNSCLLQILVRTPAQARTWHGRKGRGGSVSLVTKKQPTEAGVAAPF